MAHRDDKYWTHFGRDFTYGLVVNDSLVGVVYWLDAELLDEDPRGEMAVTDPGGSGFRRIDQTSAIALLKASNSDTT